MQPRNPSLNDFDGTLTQLAGGALVFTEPYNNVVMNDEIRKIIAANRDAFAKLSKEVAALEAEQSRLSAALSEMQLAHTPEIQPLANSGEYQPLNLSGSGQYTIMDLSDSSEINPEVQQLIAKLSTLENQVTLLNEQKKKYSASPYIIMGELQLDQEEIRARSHEILEKIKQQTNKEAYKLAEGAKEYLAALLADQTTPVYIISKNHEEYIRAILLFNGLSETQINQIQIHDVRHGGGKKYATAGKILSDYPPGSVVIIADDDPNDCLRMQRAAQERGLRTISRTQPAGQFHFPGILEEFSESLSAAAKKSKSAEKFHAKGLRASGLWKRSSEDAEQPALESPSPLKKSRSSDGE